jgi:phosphohistidine phosphatase
MKLYLVQHAKAAAPEVDPQRPLTKEGLREIKKVADFIRPLNLTVDCLWHSGKRRALQTADVLAEVIKVGKSNTAHDGLGPNSDVTPAKEELALATDDLMIVGHLPFLARLASLLLAGSESANTVVFRNAGIVCLNRSNDGSWHLEWSVIPSVIS